MTSRYIQSEHCLQELPEMEYPWPDWSTEKSAQYFEQKHACRKLRCSSDFKGEDGKIYEEGVDYNVFYAKDARLFSEALGIDYKKLPLKGFVAIPIEKIPAKLDSNPLAFYDPSQHLKTNSAIPIQSESEDELWDELLRILFREVDPSLPNNSDLWKARLKFSIT